MSRPAPRVQIVTATDEHAGALAEFFRSVWDPAATEAKVLAGRAKTRSNRVSPGQPHPTYLALVGDRVAGYLSSLPARFWIEGSEVHGWWAKGLMVLPEFRNGPLGVLLVREQAKQLPVLGSLAVNPPALRLFMASGLTQIGPLANRFLPLRPGKIVAHVDPSTVPLENLPHVVRLAGPLLSIKLIRSSAVVLAGAFGLLLRLWRWTVAPRGYRPRPVIEVPDDADELWAAVREQIRAGVVRDAAHFTDNYGGRLEGKYRAVEVRLGGQLRGLGVVRVPKEVGDARLGGLRVAVLSEVLFDPRRPRDGRALLAAAETVAMSVGAHGLLLSGTSRALDRLAGARGYVRLPPNIRYLVRLPREELPPLEDWWLVRGDGGADDAF